MDPAPVPATPLATTLALLHAHLPATDRQRPADWPLWAGLLPHAVTAASYHPGTTPAPTADAAAWLLDRAAANQRVQGRPADAVPLSERALAITEAAHGPDDLSLAQRALAIYEAAHGPDHPRTAICRDNLAIITDLAGRG